jgi:hypothetical protein
VLAAEGWVGMEELLQAGQRILHEHELADTSGIQRRLPARVPSLAWFSSPRRSFKVWFRRVRGMPSLSVVMDWLGRLMTAVR